MKSLTTLSRSLVLPSVMAALLLAGCSTNRDQAAFQRLSRFSPPALLEQGQKALRIRDFEEAVRVYEALNARYPFTNESRQARIDIIYAYYKLGEKETAKDAADTFIRENPTHPRLDYAWYLMGLIDFERTPYAVERWLRVDFAARPPQTARDAFDAFRTVVTRFPKSIYAADARQRMVYLRNRLADYELRIAAHYMERGAWVAAAQRARQAIEDYDGSPAVKEALRMMIFCYQKLDYADLADNTVKVFNENYPGESTAYHFKETSWWKPWG